MVAWDVVAIFPSPPDASTADSITGDRSVVRVPNFASADECAALCAAAERGEAEQLQNVLSSDGSRLRFEINGRRRQRRHEQQQQWRLPGRTGPYSVAPSVIPALDACTQSLADQLVRRAIALVQTDLPQLATALGLDACGASTQFIYSEGEPAINVYHPGGVFKPHKDMQSLTLLLTLSNSGADFSGGGTAFFAPDVELPTARRGAVAPAALLTPDAGTALLWSGTLLHAGAEVTAGRRVVFVASFTPIGIAG